MNGSKCVRYNSEIRSWEFHVDILKIIAEYQDRYPTLFQLVDYQVSQPPQRYKQESVPIINVFPSLLPFLLLSLFRLRIYFLMQVQPRSKKR
jgi:hypothetical protein